MSKHVNPPAVAVDEVPAPFVVDDIAPDQHRAMADYVERAPVECDGSVPPRWRAYCRVVEQAIGLVKAGKIQRQRTGEFLRAIGTHYFGDDEASRFTVDCVIRAFAQATNGRQGDVAPPEDRAEAPEADQGILSVQEQIDRPELPVDVLNDPLVQAVLARWPNAEIVEVRRRACDGADASVPFAADMEEGGPTAETAPFLTGHPLPGTQRAVKDIGDLCLSTPT
jgi:hypothetical protein